MYTTAAIKYNNADIVVITIFTGSQLKFKVFIACAVMCMQMSVSDVFDPKGSSSENVVKI
jgi:hypothetical protein